MYTTKEYDEWVSFAEGEACRIVYEVLKYNNESELRDYYKPLQIEIFKDILKEYKGVIVNEE